MDLKNNTRFQRYIRESKVSQPCIESEKYHNSTKLVSIKTKKALKFAMDLIRTYMPDFNAEPVFEFGASIKYNRCYTLAFTDFSRILGKEITPKIQENLDAVNLAMHKYFDTI